MGGVRLIDADKLVAHLRPTSATGHQYAVYLNAAISLVQREPTASCGQCQHDGEWMDDETGGGYCGRCFCGDRFAAKETPHA